MKLVRSVIKKVDRITDPQLVKGIKIEKDEEIQITLPNRKTLIIKDGYVTIM